MTSLAKSILIYNKVDTFQEIISKVNSVEINQIQELAQQIFDTEKINELRYIPETNYQ
jgi:predicted Zn-dependent peptidase